jgi:uncharacterized repeat protein (TIGR03943 family)
VSTQRERAGPVVLVAVGATVTWLAWSGTALDYIRPALEPYLLASGLLLLLLGALPLAVGQLAGRASPPRLGAGAEPAPLEPHGHRDRPGVGWLLLLPVLVLLLVQPAALGAYAAASRAARPAPAGNGAYPPLAAPVRGAVPMTMAEFVTRALRDPNRSLAGVRVRLVGFVAAADRGDGGAYRLTRFIIFCCAADAEALQVAVRGDPVRRQADQWLEVEGTWLPQPVADDPNPPPPVLVAATVRPVRQPRQPYEYTNRYGG